MSELTKEEKLKKLKEMAYDLEGVRLAKKKKEVLSRMKTEQLVSTGTPPKTEKSSIDT